MTGPLQSNPPLPLKARRAAPAEAGAVAATLSRAFFDDPVMEWLLPGPEHRREKLERFFLRTIERIHLRHGLLYTADSAGVAIWDPPGRWKVGLATQARLAPSMVGVFGARGVTRLLALLGHLERRHLPEPHYYLFAIGTDPTAQGRGVGASLMAPMIARCDAEKMPAYLESSNPRNLSFYRRHGFEATGTIELPRGPSLTLMRRPPRV